MQINIALSESSKEQAEILRSAWYPNTSSKQTRDSFLFNECIDRFTDNFNVLSAYIENDEDVTNQRLITIKAESNSRLRDISSALGSSIAATYRAIINYTLNSIENPKKETCESSEMRPGDKLLILEKIALLEKQIATCNSTLHELKTILEEI